jgi:hypothetical protein
MTVIAPYMLIENQYQEDNPFVNTERFSPVRYEGDLPDKRDPYFIPIEEWPEKKEEGKVLEAHIIDNGWWHKQKDRCINGYTVKNARRDGSDVTITGRHYFYLNYAYIYAQDKDTKSKVKTLIRPRFTDLDYEEAWVIESMFILEKDNQDLKARQKGYSFKMAGMVLVYNFLFVRHSQNVIIAGNDKDSDNLFSMCVKMIRNMVNTQFYKELIIDRDDKIEAKHFGSSITKLTAGSMGQQSVSRFSPYFVVYEEVGKWAQGLVRATNEFVQPALYNEGVKTGYCIYIGTGGNMDGGAADLEEIYYNPSEYNVLEFPDFNEPEHMRRKETVGRFVPSWMYTKIDKDGNSLKTESIEYHKKIARTKNKESEILHWVNHPIYASQAFMIPGGGYFGETLQGKLLEERNDIISKREKRNVQYGNLIWVDKLNWNAGVKFVPGPDDQGRMLVAITERPKIDTKTGKPYVNLYKQATDSYDRDEAQTSSSKGSSVIGHGFLDADTPSNYPVARITIRPETWNGGAEAFYEEVLKLNIYYDAINLIEYSNLRIFDFYKAKGFNYLLKERPRLMIAKWIQDSKVENTYGIDPNTKHHWLSELKDYLIDNNTYGKIKEIKDPEILMALAKFKYTPGKGRYNCDLTICMALLSVLFEDERELEVVKSMETEQRRNPSIKYKRVGNAFKVIH